MLKCLCSFFYFHLRIIFESSLIRNYRLTLIWIQCGSGAVILHSTNLGCDGAGSGLLSEQVHDMGGELTAGLVILLQLL
jgi:hypothetical protein